MRFCDTKLIAPPKISQQDFEPIEKNTISILLLHGRFSVEVTSPSLKSESPNIAEHWYPQQTFQPKYMAELFVFC